MATPAPTYVLTRFVILRLLGLVYTVAFLVFLNQFQPLIGHDGLLPADRFLERIAAGVGSRWNGFIELPSLFWLDGSDTTLRTVGWVGLACAVASWAASPMLAC